MNMEIVKLDNRHTMKRAGYQYAVKLSYGEAATIGGELIETLNRIHNTHATFYKFFKPNWNRYYSSQWGFYQSTNRVLWISVVNEADLTMALITG